MGKRTFTMVCKKLDLAKSKLLYKFNAFDPKEWTIVKGSPKWSVGHLVSAIAPSFHTEPGRKYHVIVWRPHLTDIGERKYELGTKHAD